MRQHIYDIIVDIAEYRDSNDLKKDFDKLMSDLGMVELQPQVMDFLMCKIRNLDDTIINVLLTNILFCINYYNQSQVVSKNNVRAMLVLYIIYIKFCNQSYRAIGAQNLFKTFYRLCMTAKALNINGIHQEGGHRYLAERYFMDCSFIDYQFKRLNYKYYNFSKSRIICSTFEQCNFMENEFVETRIRNGKFKLCTLKTRLEKIIIDGRVEIENSIIDTVNMSKIAVHGNRGIIYFKGCTILKLDICDTDNRQLKLLFENCILSDVKIRRSKGIIIEIRECVSKNKVSLDYNSVIYSDNWECFDRPVKTLAENLHEQK